jgi:hypothetical protein
LKEINKLKSNPIKEIEGLWNWTKQSNKKIIPRNPQLHYRKHKGAPESQARSMKVQRSLFELSAELRVLFTQSANVASEMYQLEVAGLKASTQYVKLSKTFEDLKGGQRNWMNVKTN